MFTLRQLQMFEAVARLSSYSRAAEELGVSQPSVSVQVQELEKDLEVDLFDRSGRRTKLTEIGGMVYAKAAMVLESVEDAQATVDAYRGLERGRVRVGAVEPLGLYVLPSVLREFSDDHPAIDVELTLEGHADLLNGLQRARLDLAYSDEPAEGVDGVESEPAGNARWVVVVPRDHPFALQQRAESLEFRDERFIVEGTDSVSSRGLRWLVTGFEGAEPQVAMQVGSAEALKQMVRAGLGIAVTYEHVVEAEYVASQLHRVFVADLGDVRPLYVLRRSAAAMPPAAEAFGVVARGALEQLSG